MSQAALGCSRRNEASWLKAIVRLQLHDGYQHLPGHQTSALTPFLTDMIARVNSGVHRSGPSLAHGSSHQIPLAYFVK